MDESNFESKKSDKEACAERLQWQNTTSALKSALDQWDIVSQQCLGPSQDEQMIMDMQKLLKQLQEKLKELS